MNFNKPNVEYEKNRFNIPNQLLAFALLRSMGVARCDAGPRIPNLKIGNQDITTPSYKSLAMPVFENTVCILYIYIMYIVGVCVCMYIIGEFYE